MDEFIKSVLAADDVERRRSHLPSDRLERWRAQARERRQARQEASSAAPVIVFKTNANALIGPSEK
jgi:hypothetical protein